MKRMKAHAAGAGGGVGAALATLMIIVLQRNGIDLGAEGEVAVTILVAAVVAWIVTERSPANA